jgi:hypothetical protein
MNAIRMGSGTELSCWQESLIQPASWERFSCSSFQMNLTLTVWGFPTNPLARKYLWTGGGNPARSFSVIIPGELAECFDSSAATSA